MSHFDENSHEHFKRSLRYKSNSDSEETEIKLEENQVQFIPVKLHNGGKHDKHSRTHKHSSRRYWQQKPDESMIKRNIHNSQIKTDFSFRIKNYSGNLSALHSRTTKCLNRDTLVSAVNESVRNHQENSKDCVKTFEAPKEFPLDIQYEKLYSRQEIYITAEYVYNMNQTANSCYQSNSEDSSMSERQLYFRQNKNVGTKENTSYRQDGDNLMTGRRRKQPDANYGDGSIYPFHFLEKESNFDLQFDGPFLNLQPRNECDGFEQMNMMDICPKSVRTCDHNSRSHFFRGSSSTFSQTSHNSAYNPILHSFKLKLPTSKQKNMMKQKYLKISSSEHFETASDDDIGNHYFEIKKQRRFNGNQCVCPGVCGDTSSEENQLSIIENGRKVSENRCCCWQVCENTENAKENYFAKIQEMRAHENQCCCPEVCEKVPCESLFTEEIPKLKYNAKTCKYHEPLESIPDSTSKSSLSGNRNEKDIISENAKLEILKIGKDKKIFSIHRFIPKRDSPYILSTQPILPKTIDDLRPDIQEESSLLSAFNHNGASVKIDRLKYKQNTEISQEKVLFIPIKIKKGPEVRKNQHISSSSLKREAGEIHENNAGFTAKKSNLRTETIKSSLDAKKEEENESTEQKSFRPVDGTNQNNEIEQVTSERVTNLSTGNVYANAEQAFLNSNGNNKAEEKRSQEEIITKSEGFNETPIDDQKTESAQILWKLDNDDLEHLSESTARNISEDLSDGLDATMPNERTTSEENVKEDTESLFSNEELLNSNKGMNYLRPKEEISNSFHDITPEDANLNDQRISDHAANAMEIQIDDISDKNEEKITTAEETQKDIVRATSENVDIIDGRQLKKNAMTILDKEETDEVPFQSERRSEERKSEIILEENIEGKSDHNIHSPHEEEEAIKHIFSDGDLAALGEALLLKDENEESNREDPGRNAYVSKQSHGNEENLEEKKEDTILSEENDKSTLWRLNSSETKTTPNDIASESLDNNDDKRRKDYAGEHPILKEKTLNVKTTEEPQDRQEKTLGHKVIADKSKMEDSYVEEKYPTGDERAESLKKEETNKNISETDSEKRSVNSEMISHIKEANETSEIEGDEITKKDSIIDTPVEEGGRDITDYEKQEIIPIINASKGEDEKSIDAIEKSKAILKETIKEQNVISGDEFEKNKFSQYEDNDKLKKQEFINDLDERKSTILIDQEKTPMNTKVKRRTADDENHNNQNIIGSTLSTEKYNLVDENEIPNTGESSFVDGHKPTAITKSDHNRPEYEEQITTYTPGASSIEEVKVITGNETEVTQNQIEQEFRETPNEKNVSKSDIYYKEDNASETDMSRAETKIHNNQEVKTSNLPYEGEEMEGSTEDEEGNIAVISKQQKPKELSIQRIFIEPKKIRNSSSRSESEMNMSAENLNEEKQDIIEKEETPKQGEDEKEITLSNAILIEKGKVEIEDNGLRSKKDMMKGNDKDKFTREQEIMMIKEDELISKKEEIKPNGNLVNDISIKSDSRKSIFDNENQYINLVETDNTYEGKKPNSFQNGKNTLNENKATVVNPTETLGDSGQESTDIRKPESPDKKDPRNIADPNEDNYVDMKIDYIKYDSGKDKITSTTRSQSLTKKSLGRNVSVSEDMNKNILTNQEEETKDRLNGHINRTSSTIEPTERNLLFPFEYPENSSEFPSKKIEEKKHDVDIETEIRKLKEPSQWSSVNEPMEDEKNRGVQNMVSSPSDIRKNVEINSKNEFRDREKKLETEILEFKDLETSKEKKISLSTPTRQSDENYSGVLEESAEALTSSKKPPFSEERKLTSANAVQSHQMEKNASPTNEPKKDAIIKISNESLSKALKNDDLENELHERFDKNASIRSKEQSVVGLVNRSSGKTEKRKDKNIPSTSSNLETDDNEQLTLQKQKNAKEKKHFEEKKLDGRSYIQTVPKIETINGIIEDIEEKVHPFVNTSLEMNDESLILKIESNTKSPKAPTETSGMRIENQKSKDKRKNGKSKNDGMDKVTEINSEPKQIETYKRKSISENARKTSDSRQDKQLGKSKRIKTHKARTKTPINVNYETNHAAKQNIENEKIAYDEKFGNSTASKILAHRSTSTEGRQTSAGIQTISDPEKEQQTETIIQLDKDSGQNKEKNFEKTKLFDESIAGNRKYALRDKIDINEYPKDLTKIKNTEPCGCFKSEKESKLIGELLPMYNPMELLYKGRVEFQSRKRCEVSEHKRKCHCRNQVLDAPIACTCISYKNQTEYQQSVSKMAFNLPDVNCTRIAYGSSTNENEMGLKTYHCCFISDSLEKACSKCQGVPSDSQLGRKLLISHKNREKISKYAIDKQIFRQLMNTGNNFRILSNAEKLKILDSIRREYPIKKRNISIQIEQTQLQLRLGRIKMKKKQKRNEIIGIGYEEKIDDKNKIMRNTARNNLKRSLRNKYNEATTSTIIGDVGIYPTTEAVFKKKNKRKYQKQNYRYLKKTVINKNLNDENLQRTKGVTKKLKQEASLHSKVKRKIFKENFKKSKLNQEENCSKNKKPNLIINNRKYPMLNELFETNQNNIDKNIKATDATQIEYNTKRMKKLSKNKMTIFSNWQEPKNTYELEWKMKSSCYQKQMKSQDQLFGKKEDVLSFPDQSKFMIDSDSQSKPPINKKEGKSLCDLKYIDDEQHSSNVTNKYSTCPQECFMRKLLDPSRIEKSVNCEMEILEGQKICKCGHRMKKMQKDQLKSIINNYCIIPNNNCVFEGSSKVPILHKNKNIIEQIFEDSNVMQNFDRASGPSEKNATIFTKSEISFIKEMKKQFGNITKKGENHESEDKIVQSSIEIQTYSKNTTNYKVANCKSTNSNKRVHFRNPVSQEYSCQKILDNFRADQKSTGFVKKYQFVENHKFLSTQSNKKYSKVIEKRNELFNKEFTCGGSRTCNIKEKCERKQTNNNKTRIRKVDDIKEHPPRTLKNIPIHRVKPPKKLKTEMKKKYKRSKNYDNVFFLVEITLFDSVLQSFMEERNFENIQNSPRDKQQNFLPFPKM